MKNFYNIILYLIIIIQFLVVCILYRNTKRNFETKINALEYKLEQNEERQKREIETCLDIIVNKRWD